MVKLKKKSGLSRPLVLQEDGIDQAACLCNRTSALPPLIYLQWMILAPIVGYVVVQLTFPSDEYVVVFDVALFVLLLIFIPAFLIALCVKWSDVKLTVQRKIRTDRGDSTPKISSKQAKKEGMSGLFSNICSFWSRMMAANKRSTSSSDESSSSSSEDSASSSDESPTSSEEYSSSSSSGKAAPRKPARKPAQKPARKQVAKPKTSGETISNLWILPKKEKKSESSESSSSDSSSSEGGQKRKVRRKTASKSGTVKKTKRVRKPVKQSASATPVPKEKKSETSESSSGDSSSSERAVRRTARPKATPDAAETSPKSPQQTKKVRKPASRSRSSARKTAAKPKRNVSATRAKAGTSTGSLWNLFTRGGTAKGGAKKVSGATKKMSKARRDSLDSDGSSPARKQPKKKTVKKPTRAASKSKAKPRKRPQRKRADSASSSESSASQSGSTVQVKITASDGSGAVLDRHVDIDVHAEVTDTEQSDHSEQSVQSVQSDQSGMSKVLTSEGSDTDSAYTQESEHSDSNISIKVEVNTENQGEEKPDMVAEMMEKDRRDSEYSSH